MRTQRTMRLTSFQIEQFRNILDSGPIDVEPLTVVVGKNEVGKTSLLRALQKLNPFLPDPYVMDSEWPRGRRQERDAKKVVCRAKFSLTAAEVAELSKLGGSTLPDGTVEFSRDYGGTLYLRLPWGEELLSAKPALDVLDGLVKTLPPIPAGIGDPFRLKAMSCLEEGRQAILTGKPTEVTQVKARTAKTLQAARSPVNPALTIEQQFEEAYSTKLAEAATTLAKSRTPERAVREAVTSWLPTFIYMSDYRAFTGSAQLDQVLERQKRKALTDEDRTLLMILKLSGLDLEKEVEKGKAEDREQRQYDLGDASATLTRTVSERWGQRRYKIEFRADGQLFYTFVQDENDPSLIRLEERSKGFQWFFSFDLLFMNESKGTFRNCVILLDEPGLNLHPSAQRDLLRRLEAYAKDNVMIYTTHLPFMIDLTRPERIRVLTESSNGTRVTSNLTEGQPEAQFVLQAALGIDGSTSYLLSSRNLVVEGVEDYWILTELSNLFRRSGKPALPLSLFVTPAGGAPKVASIATLMIGQKLDVVALLDSDRAGHTAGQHLLDKWLTRYQSSTATVIHLGEAVGRDTGEFALEDLFPERFYLDFVKEEHSRELKVAGIDELTLIGDDCLWKRVDRALRSQGIEFRKFEVAQRVHAALVKMANMGELPPETVSMTERLISRINAAIEQRPGAGVA